MTPSDGGNQIHSHSNSTNRENYRRHNTDLTWNEKIRIQNRADGIDKEHRSRIQSQITDLSDHEQRHEQWDQCAWNRELRALVNRGTWIAARSSHLLANVVQVGGQFTHRLIS